MGTGPDRQFSKEDTRGILSTSQDANSHHPEGNADKTTMRKHSTLRTGYILYEQDWGTVTWGRHSVEQESQTQTYPTTQQSHCWR